MVRVRSTIDTLRSTWYSKIPRVAAPKHGLLSSPEAQPNLQLTLPCYGSSILRKTILDPIWYHKCSRYDRAVCPPPVTRLAWEELEQVYWSFTNQSPLICLSPPLPVLPVICLCQPSLNIYRPWASFAHIRYNIRLNEALVMSK